MTPGPTDWYRAACGRMVLRTDRDCHLDMCKGCLKVEAWLTNDAIKRAGKRLRELSKHTLGESDAKIE